MLEAMKNCGRWSEIDEVRLSDIILGDTALENMLSIRVLELPTTCWLMNEKTGNQKTHLLSCLGHNLKGLC